MQHSIKLLNLLIFRIYMYIDYYLGKTFIGNLGLTIIAAVLLTLLVEIPFGKLETRLMKKLTMQEKQNTLLK